ncbi:MAG: alanine--glyoxylate aminotransferase family protein [Alphaproteobacteria bacterium]|nr:MAG: alanine--glyoxylate aminotransferase family protein [Alphaproteobacteria bacterium]
MTLARGRHFLSIPGPSVMPERVLRAMHRDAPNIYEGEIIALTREVIAGLKRVACTGHHAMLYISNGHGAWEAALTNTLSRGDRVLALATGRFARGWAEMARRLGVAVEILDFGPRAAVDPDRLEDALRAAPDTRAVLVCQTDTASSALNDIPAIRAAMDAAGSSALLMTDNIASLACDEFHMDAWGVDVTVAACQKGLMTPPGVGIVFAGPRAEAARRRADLVTPYWDWRPRMHPEEQYQLFCGTAPTHHIFGLAEALRMIFEEGLEAVWARHRVLAGAVHAAVEAWGSGGPWELNIPDPAARSAAVTTIRAGTVDVAPLRALADATLGVTLGVGLALGTPVAGSREPGVFRIGHMGHVNPAMLLGTLGAVESAMQALGLPHGRGAVEAAAAVIAAAADRPARAAQ